jgi:hypothetical protein
MALQIVNDGTAHPTRLLDVLDFCRYLKKPILFSELGAAVMPTVDGDYPILKDVIKHLSGMNIVHHDGEVITVSEIPEEASSRDVIRDAIISQQNSNNQLLSHYYAWLVHKSSHPDAGAIFSLKPADISAQYNREVGQGEEENLFNAVKGNSFRLWANFLGLGFSPEQTMFIPLPVELIESSLSELFRSDHTLSATDFLTGLGARFPFLDGGRIFSEVEDKCGPLNTVSQSVSSALRILHDERCIKLIEAADAPTQITLCKDLTHDIKAGVYQVALTSARGVS